MKIKLNIFFSCLSLLILSNKILEHFKDYCILFFNRFQLHPLLNSLTFIVIDNDNCIYINDNIGNIWKSYDLSTFNKLQFKVNISIKKLIFYKLFF